MVRRLEPGRLVVASHNAGKLREIAALVEAHGIEPVSAAALGLPEPEETGDSFRANAELKACAAAIGASIVSLADDSGLCVEALGGAPGIFSARWAGEPRNFGLAMERVEAALREVGPGVSRKAAFICGLALAWPDGHTEYFEGKIDGHLVWPPRGTRGFGYDPIFVADGDEITFAEMDPDRKYAISHRARAFDRLVRSCLS